MRCVLDTQGVKTALQHWMVELTQDLGTGCRKLYITFDLGTILSQGLSEVQWVTLAPQSTIRLENILINTTYYMLIET